MDKAKNKIILYPMGKIGEEVLNSLEKTLEEEFNCKIERHSLIEVPRDTLSPWRSQYNSSLILTKLRNSLDSEISDKVLAVADVDLYAEGLNFVFGEAECGGQFAVISLARLRQSFYSLPESKTVFLERANKEAFHELGHVFGLEHCPDPGCVMHFSNSLSDTDRKSASFCSKCQARLKDA
jgi:archaemetzincin